MVAIRWLCAKIFKKALCIKNNCHLSGENWYFGNKNAIFDETFFQNGINL